MLQLNQTVKLPHQISVRISPSKDPLQNCCIFAVMVTILIISIYSVSSILATELSPASPAYPSIFHLTWNYRIFNMLNNWYVYSNLFLSRSLSLSLMWQEYLDFQTSLLTCISLSPYPANGFFLFFSFFFFPFFFFFFW